MNVPAACSLLLSLSGPVLSRTKFILGCLKYTLNQYIEKGERMKRIYNIILMVSILALSVIASASTLKIASAKTHSGPYFTIDPLKTTIGPMPAVGQNFTVAVKLLNVTSDNAPIGISGIEIHVTWNHTLIEPLSFESHVGNSVDGVLLGPSILPGISPGWYLDDTNAHPIISAPYTNATFFNYAAASSSGPWWSNMTTSGIIVYLTFKVDQQPMPYANSTIHLEDSLAYLVDAASGQVPHSADDGTLLVTNPLTTDETVIFAGVGNFTVSITSDTTLNITAPPTFSNTTGVPLLRFNVTSPDGFCNVTIPYNFMSGNFSVTVDGNTMTPTVLSGSVASYVWFNFTAGDHAIVITSQYYIPEFATTSLLLFLMITTMVGTIVATSLRKRKFHR
jgi:hypothetical protein